MNSGAASVQDRSCLNGKQNAWILSNNSSGLDNSVADLGHEVLWVIWRLCLTDVCRRLISKKNRGLF
jgi:hypothetical protein